MRTRKQAADAIPDFGALLSDEECEQLKETAKGFTMNRNVAIYSLRLSREQIINGHEGKRSPEEARRAIALLLDTVNEYREHVEALREITDAAIARLSAARETLFKVEAVR